MKILPPLASLPDQIHLVSRCTGCKTRRADSKVSAPIPAACRVEDDSQKVGDGKQPHGAGLEALLHQDLDQAALVLCLGLGCGPACREHTQPLTQTENYSV